jgi:hypothetical protein
MIVLHTFRETHEQYQQGRIPFCVLQNLAKVMLDIEPMPNRYVFEATDISDVDIHWLLDTAVADEDYNGMLGGECHVCENEDDLLSIQGMDMEFAEAHGNRWPNVTELVMSWDACDYLPQQEGEPEWAMFLLCWNDAGGPVFYVPKRMWDVAHVAEHVAASKAFWDRS